MEACHGWCLVSRKSSRSERQQEGGAWIREIKREELGDSRGEEQRTIACGGSDVWIWWYSGSWP